MSTKQYSVSEAGHEIELTRRGKPVAVVVSVREFEHLRGERPGFKARYEAYLSSHPDREFYFDEDFADSVRDRSPGREVDL